MISDDEVVKDPRQGQSQKQNNVSILNSSLFGEMFLECVH